MPAWFNEPIQTIRGMSVGAALAPGYEVSVAKNPMDKTLTNWPTAAMNPGYDGTGPLLGKVGTNSMYHITDPASIAAQQAGTAEKKADTEASESSLTQEIVRNKLTGAGEPSVQNSIAKVFGPGAAPTGVPSMTASVSAADLSAAEIPGPPSYLDYEVSQNQGVQQTYPQRPVQYSEPEPSKVAKPMESIWDTPGVDVSSVFSAKGYGTPAIKKALFDDDGSFKYALSKFLNPKKE